MRRRLLLAFVLLIANAIAQEQKSEWSSLDRQAEALYTQGDVKQAIRVAKLAVDAASDPKQTAHSLDRLGFFEYTAGELSGGEAHLRRALAIRQSTPGADSVEYAESANDLALMLRDAGRLAEARPLAEQAVAIRSRLLGARDPRTAESLNTLASTEAMAGEYDSAVARFEQARAIHESQPEPREFSEEYGTLCINLAGTYQRTGRYVNAAAMFDRGLAVLRVRPGVQHPAYSASLVAYATLLADMAQYSQAEKQFDEASRLVPRHLGEQHAVYAQLLNNRGALYRTMGNFAQSEADYRKSLEIKRNIFGPAALTIGASLRNLAVLVHGRNPAEGEKLFQEAADLYSRNAKPPPFDFASALRGLAEAQRSRGDLAAARATLERARQVAASGLGSKHPLQAAILRDLGVIHQASREYADAVARLREAIAIVTETQGEKHPDLAQYYQRLAAVLAESSDFAGAEAAYRRSFELSNSAMTEILSIGSQTSRAAVLRNLDDPVPALLAFQETAGGARPSARALAFEAVANRKGRVLDQVHDWGRSLRESREEGVRSRFRQWEALLECQSALTVALGYRDLKPAAAGSCALSGTDLAGRYERLLHDLRGGWTLALGKRGLEAVNDLRQRIDAREAEMSREIPHFASVARTVTLADIRAGLREDEGLIEIVAHARRDGRGYGAFLLAPGSDLEWVDLGRADGIDRSVQDMIAAANDWSESMANNERRSAAVAEETAGGALRSISRSLRPLTDWLLRHRGIHRVRIAPDGMLHLVPFPAIFDGEGRPLIEKFAVSYLTAGRDAAAPATVGGGEIIVAVSPGPARQTTAGGAGSAFRADRLKHLQGAEAEAREVRRWLPKAKLFGQGEATERRIKEMPRPGLLHIVGHGIVRGNENCQEVPSSPGCQFAGVDPGARVMGLSAIVLEESYGRGGGSDQDGLLTALELQALDLRGSEMLVLSQCRMADGVPSSGEGVFGMRRAASIAGVRTFVAPLWNIADAAQRALMSGFYAELASGKGRSEALRQAQLRLRGRPGTASFLSWAPVILSGDPNPLPASWFAR